MKVIIKYCGATVVRYGVMALSLITTLLLFRGPINARLRSLLDPYSFSGDALQHIPPLWYAHEQSLFRFDYIREYYWQALFPPLFKATYWLLTFFAEPAACSKIISVALSALFIATTTRASYLLAGGSSAFVTLLLATGGTLKNFPFMSGLQRAFGTWLCSLMLLFIIEGNLLALCATIVLTAMFYPAAAVFGLIALGLVLCLPGRLLSEEIRWSPRRRISTLSACAALTCLSVIPQLSAGSHYGERLSLASEQEFAEWGPNGRYTQGDRGVPMPFARKFYDNIFAALMAGKLARDTLTSVNDDSVTAIASANEGLRLNFDLTIAISIGCALLLAWRAKYRVSPHVARIGAYVVAIGCSFAAATVFFPLLYIPTRYVVITLPALVPLVFPALWTGALRAIWGTRAVGIRESIAALLGASALAALGWFSLSIKPMPTASGHRELFSYIRALPKESVIAGWPRGSINTIALFTGRNVLLHEEAHQIFHRDFLEECARRMRAMIQVYAATDGRAVKELRHSYGVTHILIDRKHLKSAPSYFAPYSQEMLSARESIGNQPLFLEQMIRYATVFKLHNLFLIDLSKLSLDPRSGSVAPGPLGPYRAQD